MGHKAVCKRACRGVLVGALLAFLAVSGNALSQNVVERAKELLRQGKPAEAFELLDPAAEQLNDAESAYLLGIAALDSGKPGLAIIAFERALAYNPAFAPARAELVRALVATGETDQARVELARLANVPVPPEVREKLAALDAQLRQAADIARRRTRGVATFVQAEAGYDTNINTGANSQSFAILRLSRDTAASPPAPRVHVAGKCTHCSYTVPQSARRRVTGGGGLNALENGWAKSLLTVPVVRVRNWSPPRPAPKGGKGQPGWEAPAVSLSEK